MSLPKKNKRFQSHEGGLSVLESHPEASTEMMPTERTTGTTIVQVSTDISAPLATVWQRGKRVTAVWSKNENRNSWVAIVGVGWKKLSDASDSANIALTVLTSQALQTTANIDYREETDGMIHEIYVW